MSYYDDETKDMESSSTKVSSSNAFKESEKSLKHVTSVSEAVSMGALDFDALTDTDRERLGVHKVQVGGKRGGYDMYSVSGFEGCYIIKDVLTCEQQVELAYYALAQSLQPPNRTNLHCHFSEKEIDQHLQSIWTTDRASLDSLDIFDVSQETSSPSVKKKKKKDKNLNRMSSEMMLSKIRWATLGYQYNWTERSYTKDEHAFFSQSLKSVAMRIATLCGESLDPECGIINFYPEGQVMGGHRDDGEKEALEKPVVSLSIGPPCVFLLGGNTKEVQPISMLLRSGDALILGGEARLKYHGVPRVFVNAHDGGAPAHLRVNEDNLQHIETLALHTNQCPLFLHRRRDESKEDDCCCDGIDPVEIQRILKVLNCARININLRQVYYSAEESKTERKTISETPKCSIC